MSFEAAWGFDPKKALAAQDLFQRSLVPSSRGLEDSIEGERVPEIEGMPRSADSQIYELRRLFRL